MRKIRCPICEKKSYFKDRESLIHHIGKYHRESIPDGWEASRYENFLRTGKEFGNCVICGGKTGWNESTRKYYRMCKSPKCKKIASDRAEANMVKKLGVTKSERMSQASTQIQMVYSKHTSGKYEVGKDHAILYDSTYVMDCITVMEEFLHLDMHDVFGPSPNQYTYHYDGRNHMYIPDLYIGGYNLEIEIKDGGDNPNNHPKIQNVDKKKEAEKDKVMEKLQKEGKIHYIKIVNKDYRDFFRLLIELRDSYDGTTKSLNPSIKATDESCCILEESVNDTFNDISTLAHLTAVSSGYSSNYRQIPMFYIKKIRTLKPNEIEKWEGAILSTLSILERKRESEASSNDGVPYELDETIREMKSHVLPEFDRHVEKLRKRK